RTPLLALLSLRRARNLGAVLAPYAALAVFAVFVDDPAVTILAFSPSALVGPRIARLLGAREESAGALMTATVVISFPLLLFGGDPLAAVVGSGTRDPAVAAGLAVGAGLVGGGTVALAYAVWLALATGVGKLLVGGHARREAAR